MVSVNSNIKAFGHSIGQNWYHVVLVPKGRYPVFAQEHQRNLAVESLNWVCCRHNIDLFTQEVMDDHVHLFVSCPPHYSIRKMVQIIKGGTSYYIRKNHPSLKKYKSLWSKGFMYRSVGSVSADVVRRYIDNSNSWTLSKHQRKLI
jgi:putative transposase